MKSINQETNLETIMRKLLEQENIDFEQFFPVRSGFILDFALLDKKIGIECDGERWHKIGNKRDRFRDWILSRAGWTIIRFRGKELENNPERCIIKVKSLID